MFFDLYVMALKFLGNIDIDDYILCNDVSSLFDKYDEDEVLVLKGIEGYALGNYNSKRDIFNKVKNDIYNAFLENPRKYLDSFFFDDRFIKDIFSYFEIRRIRRIMKGLEIQINDIISRGPKDLSERHFLMKYLKVHIDLDSEYQRKYISEILDKNILELENEEYCFLCNYVSRWMLRESGNENIPVNVFAAKFSDSRDDGGYARSTFIVMRLLEDDFSIPYAVRCICHETQHIIQNSMYRRLDPFNNNHIDSKVGLDYFEHLFMGDKYYHNNYWFSKIEYDAEKNGTMWASKFLKLFGKNVSDDLNNSLYFTVKPFEFRMQSICTKNKDEYEKEFFEYSDVYNLDSIVKKDITLLDIYPILHRLYDNNGNKISLDEMLKNDFSLGEDLNIFYPFVFDYIQRGELANSNGEYINNIYLLFDKVYQKVLTMFSSSPSFLLDLNDYSGYASSFVFSDLDDIFTSELVYYFSFLTKTSKYLYNHLDKIQDSKKFISGLDGILDKLNYLLNNNVEFFKKDNLSFLRNYNSDLLYIYNDYRKADVQKFFSDRLSKFVSDDVLKIDINGVSLKDYIYNELISHVSYEDISYLDINGEHVKFDDYVIDLIFKHFEYDDSDILTLLNLMRVPIMESDVRDLFFEKYDRLAFMYKDDLVFDVLKGAEGLADDEYNDNILSKTLVDINNEDIASQIRSVISR